MRALDAVSEQEGRGASRCEYGLALLMVGATAAVCLALRSRLQTTDVAMVLLAAVVIVAARYRRGPAVLATLVAIAAFDFLFVPPYYTFAVREGAYVLTFGVMLLVALVLSRLAARLREQAEAAQQRERRAAMRYAMARELADVDDLDRGTAIVTRYLAEAAGGEAQLALATNDGLDFAGSSGEGGPFASVAVRVAAAWALEHRAAAGQGTPQCAEAEALVVPLASAERVVGVAALVSRTGAPIGRAARRTAEVLAEQAAAALERAQLAQRHEAAQVEVEAERLRTALLSSLSHDLRTPLGSIEGAASTLLQDGAALAEEVRRELAVAILEESRRMTRLVTNLLDMVRVETGTLAVRKAWQPLEEPLGVALLRLDDRLAGRVVETHLPPELPFVPIDELLIEQVFVNLLENALKYTPADSPITIGARAENGGVLVEVADRGPGVPLAARELVFHKFHRGGNGVPAGGAGLGLTICRGIITAHGGRIWVDAREGGGAAFRFILPLDGPPITALPEG
jgi:two-component system sensor histidine kinase KdpD